MSLGFWADVIVGVHFAWVAFVVLAVPAVIIGEWRKCSWVRNSWFRNLHLVMIGIVVAESLLGLVCPLTEWEYDLRLAAGEQGYAGSFIGHWLHELMFFDFEEWVFTALYVAFGGVVVSLYVVFPPRCMKN